MLPDRVSNPGPLTYESGALPIALRGPAHTFFFHSFISQFFSIFTCYDHYLFQNMVHFSVHMITLYN